MQSGEIPSYLHRPGIRCPNAQKCVSIGGSDSTGRQRFDLDEVAVHKEGDGLALYAEGQFVPAHVHQSLHSLPREKATHRVARRVGRPGAEGQGAIGSAKLHRQLGRGIKKGADAN